MVFTFRPLDGIGSEQLVAWRYAPPYDRYDLAPADQAVLLKSGSYFCADDEDGNLVAFCCFGAEAQVAGGSYGEDTGLDVGVGLHPDAVGQGLGPNLIRAALELGVRTYGVHRFGATVAAFNERALRAAEKAGFRRLGHFVQAESGREWVQLVAEVP